MQAFIRRENLRRYRNLLTKTPDETVRTQLFKLIAEEERRQILQLISEPESEPRLARRLDLRRAR